MRLLRPFLMLALLAIVIAPVSSPTATAGDDERNFVQTILDGVTVAPPIVTDKITLFPLVVTKEPGDPGVDAVMTAIGVTFEEPEFPRRRYDVLVRNMTDRPVMVIGGTVLEGGKRDRLIRQTSIVAGGADTEVSAWPAASTSDARKLPIPFKIADSLAPLYLRQKAEYSGSANSVMTFIARWLEFRTDGDERKSLVALATSDKLKSYCLPCHEAASRFPRGEPGTPTVVGGVGVIRGRIQGMFLYGSNELVRACFPMMLKGATYPAAAIELRAKKAGIPLPDADEDPDEALQDVTKDVQAFLEKVKKARYRKDRVNEGQLGEALLLKVAGGTRGRAVGLDGKLVQLVVYPHDPFKNALYGAALDVPDPDLEDPTRPGVAELERKRRQGFRLTEAEERLLERLEPGPRNPAGGPPPAAPLPRVPGPRPPAPGRP